MIERVDMFPERLDNGRYVNGVTFKFPVILEGEMTDQWWYKESTVETVALLVHQKLIEYFHVTYEVDAGKTPDDLKGKATYAEIKAWIQEHYDGMSILSLYIAQIKDKHGLDKCENYNKSCESDAKVPQYPPEKE